MKSVGDNALSGLCPVIFAKVQRFVNVETSIDVGWSGKVRNVAVEPFIV
jgi:hypothetical protein